MRLTIDYPEELVEGLDARELENLAREALIVRLYTLGKLSSGRAADALGLSRREFLELLDRTGTGWIDEEIDLDAEASHG
jgi:predicted HTH domain antitoxin